MTRSVIGRRGPALTAIALAALLSGPTESLAKDLRNDDSRTALQAVQTVTAVPKKHPVTLAEILREALWRASVFPLPSESRQASGSQIAGTPPAESR